MKKIICLCLIIALCLSLCSCGKSQAVKDTEAAIKSIGEVTIESNEVIEKAEKLYNVLTDAEKEKLSNRMTLIHAREAFDELAKEASYDCASNIYAMLNEASDICIDGMSAIYGAWDFGINTASKFKDSGDFIYYGLSQGTDFRFDDDELEEAHKQLYPDYAEYEKILHNVLSNSFSECVHCVMMAFTIEGTYDELDSLLAEIHTQMQKLTQEYNDTAYSPKLKEYHSAVSFYVSFFKSPSGSYEQLRDTISESENAIRAYREEAAVLF